MEKEENAQAKAQEEEDACEVQIIFPHIFSVGINTNLVLGNKFINLTFDYYYYSLNISAVGTTNFNALLFDEHIWLMQLNTILKT